MSKKLKYFIIVISLASIFFSLFSLFKGQKFFDSFSGIVIGVSLIGALYFDNYKKRQ